MIPNSGKGLRQYKRSKEGEKVTVPFLFTAIMLFRALRTLLKDPKFRSLLYLTTLTLIAGTLFYHSVEGWSLLDSFYFSVITLATVGYGDFTPHTDMGKIFTVIYIFLGLGILVGFVTPIGEYLIDRRTQHIEKKEHEKNHKKENTETEFDFSGVIGKLKDQK